VDPTTVPKNFTIWKDMMLYKVREYVYVPRKEAPEICYRAMTPSIRFELDDCVSLPPLSYVQIKCEKTPEQAKMFRSMVNDFLAVSNEDEVYAVNAAAKYTKMLQILGGAVYTEDHKIIEVDTTPRIEALCELIDEVYPNPIVVVCNYRHILALVEKELNKHYKNIAVVNGDTSSTQLGAIINNFDRGQISILLSTPEPIAHSIDLTRSSTLIMYQPFPKNELNLQIVDRIRRLSSVTRGHKKLVIYQMYNDETEFLIYEKLRDKTITQNKLFSLIREELKNVYAI
jgi:SNF2 family DNA or RNA helicase